MTKSRADIISSAILNDLLGNDFFLSNSSSVNYRVFSSDGERITGKEAEEVVSNYQEFKERIQRSSMEADSTKYIVLSNFGEDKNLYSEVDNKCRAGYKAEITIGEKTLKFNTFSLNTTELAWDYFVVTFYKSEFMAKLWKLMREEGEKLPFPRL